MSHFTDSKALISASAATVLAPTTLGGTNVLDVSMRDKISIEFTATGITSGNGVFKVYISNDGTNWVQYNRLITNATVADAHNDAKVGSITLSSNTSSFLFVPYGDHFRYIGIGLDWTTDGTYTATVQTTS